MFGTPSDRQACGRARDRLGLSALLRRDARIGARGIDQRDHRNAEVVGHLHQPHRLAVAFGLGHAEIVLQPALGGRALLLSDDADALALEAAEAADDRVVVAELAVAGKRRELGDQLRHIVEAMRPRRPARDLRLLPGREVVVELGERLRRPWPRAARSRRRPRRRRSPAWRAVPRSSARARRPAFRNRDRSASRLNIGTKPAWRAGGGNWPLAWAKSRKALVYQRRSDGECNPGRDL